MSGASVGVAAAVVAALVLSLVRHGGAVHAHANLDTADPAPDSVLEQQRSGLQWGRDLTVADRRRPFAGGRSSSSPASKHCLKFLVLTAARSGEASHLRRD